MNSIIIDNDDAPFTYVKESSIEGYGLFAAKDIQKGDLVIDYRMFPKDWYKTQFSQLSEEQIRKNWYVALNDEECITSDKWSKFSYINHSREPNCDWVLSIHKVIANRDIKKDEELFIDYRTEPRPNRISFPEWILCLSVMGTYAIIGLAMELISDPLEAYKKASVASKAFPAFNKQQT